MTRTSRLNPRITSADLAARIVDIRDYGAKVDARCVRGTTMTLAAPNTVTLTSLLGADQGFPTNIVGKSLWVSGAGPGGAVLATTVTARNSATSVTVADAASTAVSNAFTIWGTDDTAAIVKAQAALGSTGGTIVIPGAGVLHTGITLGSSQSLAGQGMFSTELILKPGSNTTSVANYVSPDGVAANGLAVTIRDLTINATKDFQTAACDGLVMTTNPTSTNATNDLLFDAHSVVQNVRVIRPWRHGINSGGRGGSLYLNAYASFCGNYGIITCKDSYFIGCQAEACGSAGFDIPTGATNLFACKSFNSGAATNNPSAPGFNIHTGNSGGVVISGCSSQNNRGAGIQVVDSTGIMATALVLDGNNLGTGNSATAFAGLELSGVTYSLFDIISTSASLQGAVDIGVQTNALRIDSGSSSNEIRIKHTGSANLGSAVSSDSVIGNNRIVAAEAGQSITGRQVSSISASATAGKQPGVDFVYLVSGTTTLTLPTAVDNGSRYTIKNTGTGVVTVATTSSQTIDGATTATIAVADASIDVISDGANWRIL